MQQVPCFSCCDAGTTGSQRRFPQSRKPLRSPGFDVELAVSPLAGMKGAAGYHTSVLVDAEEYFFSPLGIVHSPTITSHKGNPDMKLYHIGLSRYNGMDLIEFLDQHFPSGHYDLLRKNCNTFSDCALFLLCDQRLDYQFKSLERLGKLADDHAGLIQKISGGDYWPNPRAVEFDLEHTILEIKYEREAHEAAISCEAGVQQKGDPMNVFAQDDFLPTWSQYGSNVVCEGDDGPVCFQSREFEEPHDRKFAEGPQSPHPLSLNVEAHTSIDIRQCDHFKTVRPQWQGDRSQQGLIGGA